MNRDQQHHVDDINRDLGREWTSQALGLTPRLHRNVTYIKVIKHQQGLVFVLCFIVEEREEDWMILYEIIFKDGVNKNSTAEFGKQQRNNRQKTEMGIIPGGYVCDKRSSQAINRRQCNKHG